VVTTTTRRHIRAIIMGVDNNRSPNKCIVVNRVTKKTTTNSEYNKESTVDSI
jgi:hypothetical protein